MLSIFLYIFFINIYFFNKIKTLYNQRFNVMYHIINVTKILLVLKCTLYTVKHYLNTELILQNSIE